MITYDNWLAIEIDDEAPSYCDEHGWEGDPDFGCPSCLRDQEVEDLATDDGVRAGRT